MLSKKLCVFGVAMLIAGACAAQSASFSVHPVDIDVGQTGDYWSGTAQVYWSGDLDSYLVEICNFSGYAIDSTLCGTWHGVGDDWEAFANVSGGYSLPGVKTTQQVTTWSFWMFLYHDADNSGTFTSGDTVVDSAKVNTH